MELKHNLTGLFILIIQVSQILAGENAEEQVGQELYEKLFRVADNKHAYLSPEGVFENIQRLVEIYKRNSFDISKPAYSPENQSLVKDLLDTLTDESCSKENLIKYNEYLSSMAVYGELIQILKRNLIEKFKKCKMEYPKPMFELINRMSYEDRLAMNLFKGDIMEQVDKFEFQIPFYTAEAFNKGVLTYLSKKAGKNALTKSEFDSLYSEHITSICLRLGKGFYREVDFFKKNVLTDTTLARINHGITGHYLIMAYMCEDASRRRQEIIDNVYSLMNVNARPKRRGLFRRKS